MEKKKIGIAQGLAGELSTDYFDFYCTKCGEKITELIFHSIDTVGVQVLAHCKPCDFSYIFKLRINPVLGPVQITSEFGKTSYKLYDRRKLKKYIETQIDPDNS